MMIIFYNKSIKSFINELSTEKDLEKIEKKVEKLDQLTKIIDKKFDNKILNIGFEDIDNLVSKSMSLINSCDPVEYAYDEVIRYITVKSSPKDLEDIKDEFSLKFNEACKEEGYDASNITGIANIENNGYKNAISGNSSGG